MNPVSGGSSYQANTTNSTMSINDKQIRGLMEQKSKLDEKIQGINQNEKLDMKEKMEQIKTVRDQIQQIETEIHQLRMEKVSNQQKKEDQAKPSSQPQSNSQIGTAAQLTMDLNKIKSLQQTKNQMERESKNHQNEVRLGRLQIEISGAGKDKGVLMEHAEAKVFKRKLNESSEIQGKIASVDKAIGNSFKDIQDKLNETTPSEEKEEENTGEAQNLLENKNNQNVKAFEPNKQIEHIQIDVRV